VFFRRTAPLYYEGMRYLVRARVKAGCEAALIEAIDNETLGAGSIAGDEYLRDMSHARLMEDGTVRWVEVCFCPFPLMEERPYWEEYFELVKVQDAHARAKCRDENGTEPWACSDCDCTARLERRLANSGDDFVPELRRGSSRIVVDRRGSSASFDNGDDLD
jgi:hypothetical protein